MEIPMIGKLILILKQGPDPIWISISIIHVLTDDTQITAWRENNYLCIDIEVLIWWLLSNEICARYAREQVVHVMHEYHQLWNIHSWYNDDLHANKLVWCEYPTFNSIRMYDKHTCQQTRPTLGQHQAIFWTNACFMSIKPEGTQSNNEAILHFMITVESIRFC